MATACTQAEKNRKTGILVSSRREWTAVLDYLGQTHEDCTPYLYGEYLEVTYAGRSVLFFHARNRKTRSAAATQYMLDHFDFSLLVDIGTCAGIDRTFHLLDVLIPNRAVNFDMSVPGHEPPIRDHDWTVYFDLSKLDFDYHTGTIATGDRPIVTKEDFDLLNDADVAIGDTESAAIAYVCRENGVENYFIKGISDFPMGINTASGIAENGMSGEQEALFSRNIPLIMRDILEHHLPRLLQCVWDRQC